MREQRDIARQLAERRGEKAQDRGDLAEIVALRVPRRDGNRERQLRGERRLHRDALRAERRERGRGAAELQHDRTLARRSEPRAMTIDRRERRRELQAERNRQRLLKPCATGENRRAMHARLPRQRVGKTRGALVDQLERVTQLEHETGVDDVLAGRAPVHVAPRGRMRRRDARRELRDQRNREIARIARRGRHPREIEIVGAAATADRVGGVERNDADGRFGARERRLEVEHPLNAHAVGKSLPHRIRREEEVEHGAVPL